MATLNPFKPAQRIVVKIGSALLVDHQTGSLRQTWLEALCSDIAQLHKDKTEIVLVSSGAIALGRNRLGLAEQALSLPQKQACAAIGQTHLTQAYEKALGAHNIMTAQALLTLNDTEDRRRWLNARSTLNTLLTLGAVPVINENDTVATDEIRYGDNDRLAARTSQMLGADTLILLSDIDGLYSADPRKQPSASHLPIIESITPEIMAMGGAPNADRNTGSGGMATKLAAAQIAVNAGCHMCIMDGTDPSPLTRLENGARCSWFIAVSDPSNARRQWISGALKTDGSVTIDAGAEAALQSGKSLLAAGITQLDGSFGKGDLVLILDPAGKEVARGLVSYDAMDAKKIIGKNSQAIDQILGYTNGPALIHRDNLVMNT